MEIFFLVAISYHFKLSPFQSGFPPFSRLPLIDDCINTHTKHTHHICAHTALARTMHDTLVTQLPHMGPHTNRNTPRVLIHAHACVHTYTYSRAHPQVPRGRGISDDPSNSFLRRSGHWRPLKVTAYVDVNGQAGMRASNGSLRTQGPQKSLTLPECPEAFV